MQWRNGISKAFRVAAFFLSLSGVALSASAIQPLTITLQPALSANTMVETPAGTTLNITNNLPQTINGLTLSPSVTDSGGTFILTSTSCGSSLASGASCNWSGSFTATVAGSHTAIVNIQWQGREYIYPQNTASSAGQAPLTLVATSPLAADTIGGIASATTIEVTNNLSSTLSGLVFTPSANGGTFTEDLGETTCSSMLAAYASCNWVGNFIASTTGSNSATLTASYSGQDYPNTQTTQTNSFTEAQMWGDNAVGQLGNGEHGTNTGTPGNVVVTGGSALMFIVQFVTGGDIVEASSDSFSCALVATGQVQCWGNNTYGQLGDNNAETHSYVPVTVCAANATESNCSSTNPLINVIAITAGARHACALISDGSMVCWGNDGSGELGDYDNSGVTKYVPVYVCGINASSSCTSGDGISDVSQIAAGAHHTCALTFSGVMVCWGNNVDGEVGDTTYTNRLVPVHVCAVGTGAGDNCLVSGQLPSVSAITTGAFHTCALINGGTVDCWGDNTEGALGDYGEDSGSNVPVHVCEINASNTCATTGVLTNVTAIMAGAHHSCALISGGGMACWGDDSYGELGDNDGTSTNQYSPVYVCSPTASDSCVTGVNILTNVTAITAGAWHSCALVDNDDVTSMYCWGNNADGELGQGDTGGFSTVPVEVSNISGTLSSLILKSLDETSGVVIITSGQARHKENTPKND